MSVKGLGDCVVDSLVYAHAFAMHSTVLVLGIRLQQ